MATDFAKAPPASGSSQRGLWGVRETAAYLGKSATWVYQAVELGDIPHHRVGGGIRFFPDEIVAWVKAGCPRPRSDS